MPQGTTSMTSATVMYSPAMLPKSRSDSESTSVISETHWSGFGQNRCLSVLPVPLTAAEMISVDPTAHSASPSVTEKCEVGGRFTMGIGIIAVRLLTMMNRKSVASSGVTSRMMRSCFVAVRDSSRLADEERQHRLADVLALARSRRRQLPVREPSPSDHQPDGHEKRVDDHDETLTGRMADHDDSPTFLGMPHRSRRGEDASNDARVTSNVSAPTTVPANARSCGHEERDDEQSRP